MALPSASVSKESKIILAWYRSLSMGRVFWRIPRAGAADARSTCRYYQYNILHVTM